MAKDTLLFRSISRKWILLQPSFATQETGYGADRVFSESAVVVEAFIVLYDSISKSKHIAHNLCISVNNLLSAKSLCNDTYYLVPVLRTDSYKKGGIMGIL